MSTENPIPCLFDTFSGAMCTAERRMGTPTVCGICGYNPEKREKWSDYIIGYGQVGQAVAHVLRDSCELLQAVDAKTSGLDIRSLRPPRKESTKVLHICFPWSDDFYSEVAGYMSRIEHDLVIIHSTVMPDKLPSYIPAVYSPIRGQHDNLKDDVKEYVKCIACKYPVKLELAHMRFQDAGLKVQSYGQDVSTLEWAKHLSNTLYYHWMIAYRQMVHLWSNELNLKEELLWSFTKQLYDKTRIQYPTYFDPKGIGGHCVLQNTLMLEKKFDKPDTMSTVLELLLYINQKVKEESQDA